MPTKPQSSKLASVVGIKKVLMNSHQDFLVGAAGFEPATSCSQSRRDNRATLRPVAVRAGFEPAVRLPVRQFSKLLVSATHPSHRVSSKRTRKLLV